MVLNLVSTTDEQTEALIGVVADGGFHVGTMVFGPQDPDRSVRTQRIFVRSDAAQLAGLVSRVDAGQLRIEIAERFAVATVFALFDWHSATGGVEVVDCSRWAWR